MSRIGRTPLETRNSGDQNVNQLSYHCSSFILLTSSLNGRGAKSARRGRISTRDGQCHPRGERRYSAATLAVVDGPNIGRDYRGHRRTLERSPGVTVSGFHSTDRDRPVAPDTEGSEDADKDAETMSLADAMGAPDDDDGAPESDRITPRYCGACGDPTRLSGLTRLAIHDDSGASHAAICRDCAHDAAEPPACAICRSPGSETYVVTYVRNDERFGTLCAACRVGLCEGVESD